MELLKSRSNLVQKAQYDRIINLLTSDAAPNAESEADYYNARRRFKLIEGNEGPLLIRTKRESIGDLRSIVHADELFDKILALYRSIQPCTANKLHEYLRERYLNVSLESCRLFLSCYMLLKSPRILREGYLSIIDMSILPDKKASWILLYQDYPSKRSYARALNSKRCRIVADELCKILIMEGFCEAIYSDQGKQFTSKVLNEIANIIPSINIVYQKSHYHRIQISLLQSFKNKVLEWIEHNPQLGWSIGIYICVAALNHGRIATDAIETGYHEKDDDSVEMAGYHEKDDDAVEMACYFERFYDPKRYRWPGIPIASLDLVRDTARIEMQRLGLRAMPNSRGGDSLFCSISQHFTAFGGKLGCSTSELRVKAVDFLLDSDLAQRFIELADLTIRYESLKSYVARDRRTWPPPQVCFAISQILGIRINLFMEYECGGGFGDEVVVFWPQSKVMSCYPPIPSAEWMCIRYNINTEHFVVLLPTNHTSFAKRRRGRKRKNIPPPENLAPLSPGSRRQFR